MYWTHHFCSGSTTDRVPIFLSQVGSSGCPFSAARATEPVPAMTITSSSGAMKRSFEPDPIMS